MMTEGMKSSELWYGVASVIAAVALTMNGASETVALAIIAQSGAYAVSRGMAKKTP
jgi:hypothetical protein